MFNRAQAVDQQFRRIIFEANGPFPAPQSRTRLDDVDLEPCKLVEIFESQVTSRLLDIKARELKANGECFYTIGSSGHEGNAVIADVFRVTDMAFLHYRSGAFYIQRSKKSPGESPIFNMLLSLVASADDPISGGRHKVIGSKNLFIPPQTSTIASHLPKAVGAALSIHRSKDLDIDAPMPKDSVVLCSFGDASLNHATALSAFNTAALVAYQHVKLPLVFVCEDNGMGISTPTSEGWVEKNFAHKPGLNYIKADGLNVLDVYQKARHAEFIARKRKKPVFLHISCVRLLGHAGSDVESSYRSLEAIEAMEFQDPLLHTARILLEESILTSTDILRIYEDIKNQIDQVALDVIKRPKLTDPKEIQCVQTNDQSVFRAPSEVESQTRMDCFGRDYKKLSNPQHMAKLLNWGLQDILLRYSNTLVFGEDVAQKGGVYHVTDDLYKKFGTRRVFNSPLDETAILGTAIGLAHNGFLPIPEIQFLAYVHNAQDQIRGEAATLSFFSQRQYQNPMVVRIAGLAYQKGFGGHFHNDNSLAVFRDIPGLVIAVPSNGADAVRMLRCCVKEAYEKGRVCVFIEPIALYMTKDLLDEGDKKWSFPYPDLSEEDQLGSSSFFNNYEPKKKELAVVTYANGVYLSAQAQAELKKKKKYISVLDLKWIAPLNEEELIKKLSSYENILIIDECRKTGSLSEQLSLLFYQNQEKMNFKKLELITADDCLIPLGLGARATLPSKDDIFHKALEMLSSKTKKNK
ncbi:MAG: MFS transporter [Bdellovibrionaceae bacterium]|nr:MFS transporter [Pseudobdellovibrionaceae bacterium]